MSFLNDWFGIGKPPTIPNGPQVFPSITFPSLQLPIPLISLPPSLPKPQSLFPPDLQKIIESENRVARNSISYYDTIEINKQLYYNFFVDLHGKDLTQSNFMCPRKLASGHKLSLSSIHLTIPKRLPSTLIEDLFHSLIFRFQVNHKIIFEEPVDMFDIVQIIPEGYKLPDIIAEGDAKDVLNAFGAKLPDSSWPQHNGINRAIKKLNTIQLNSDFDLSGILTVKDPNNNFVGVPVRIALVGAGNKL